MSKAKDYLLQLEQADNFVFHGAPFKLDHLSPKQAKTIRMDEQVDDGNPAVFASSLVDYAIFMALINEKNCPLGFRSAAKSSIDAEGHNYLEYCATQKSLDQLNDDKVGYVHVCNKDFFTERSSDQIEWTSFLDVRPVEVIEVRREDLPRIEVI